MPASRWCHSILPLWILLPILPTIIGCSTGGGGGGAAGEPSAVVGQTTYEANCATCHKNPGLADGTAPDLAGFSATQVEAGLTAEGHAAVPVELTTGDYANIAAFLGQAPSGEGEGEGEAEGEGEGEGEDDGTGPHSPPGCVDELAEAGWARQTGGVTPTPANWSLPAPAIPRFIRQADRPAAVDLSDSVPTPCHLGSLNSCTAWVGAYGLMTFQAAENIDGWDDLDRGDRQFSPTFVFNQANAFRMGTSSADSCYEAGMFLVDLFTLLRDTGCVTWTDMPYTVDDCETQPDAALIERAADFRIEYFRVIDRDVATTLSFLAERIPVVAVLRIGAAFGSLGPGEVYDVIETSSTYAHPLLVAGYDDEIGAIKVMNAWGTGWADGGFGSVSYDVWEDIVTEAYVVGRGLDTPYASVDEVAAGRGVPRGPAIGGREAVCNPLLDSDGDGYPDTMEREFGLDPLVPDDNPDYEPVDDADCDGWPDATEAALGTDPESPDDFPFGSSGQ